MIDCRRMKRRLFACIFSLAIAAPAMAAESASPDTWLWAWQRNEDLSNLTRNPIGIAYLAQTITLRDGRLLLAPRDKSLRVPPHAVLMPVTRIEVSRAHSEPLTDEQASKVADAVVNTLSSHTIGVQIDFDARQSERPFYLKLLNETKRKLPTGAKLSMTALASWCLFDTWLERAPVDEVVPMFFSMGADTESVLNYLKEGRPLCARCRSSLGVSCDQPVIANTVLHSKSASQRTSTYIFTSKPWSTLSLRSAFALLVPLRP